MDKRYLEEILKQVAGGELDTGAALEKLKDLPFRNLDFATLDNHRSLRTGAAEVVFCQGKTSGQVAEIMKALHEENSVVLGTRATEEDYRKTRELVSTAVYYKDARIIVITEDCEKERKKGPVAVVTAGTADIPVAEEAAVTAETLGCTVDRVYDVGVAGIHRLFDKLDIIKKAKVVIVIAGMEGALASVVGGLVEAPVIAVPTSIGYGANLNGLSALLSMLNSCAAGVGVVNIDNGYGGACLADKICMMEER